MGCLLVEPPKIMLSFKPHWRNQDKSTYIYIYIISLCQILIFVVFFWEELPPFFSTGDPLLDRRRSRRPPGARLAPAWRPPGAREGDDPGPNFASGAGAGYPKSWMV